jgi:hypothetical protein
VSHIRYDDADSFTEMGFVGLYALTGRGVKIRSGDMLPKLTWEMRQMFEAALPEKLVALPQDDRVVVYDGFQLEAMAPKEWVVDSVIPVGGLVTLIGKYETFKSFIALDLALSVATGTPWHGQPCEAGRRAVHRD